jgi:hypothetical protein
VRQSELGRLGAVAPSRSGNKQGATAWPPGILGSNPRLLARAVAATAAGRIAGGARVVAAVTLVGHSLPFYSGGRSVARVRTSRRPSRKVCRDRIRRRDRRPSCSGGRSCSWHQLFCPPAKACKGITSWRPSRPRPRRVARNEDNVRMPTEYKGDLRPTIGPSS